MSKHIIEPINESEIELTNTLASSFGRGSAKELIVSYSDYTGGFLYKVTSHNVVKLTGHNIKAAIDCYNEQP